MMPMCRIMKMVALATLVVGTTSCGSAIADTIVYPEAIPVRMAQGLEICRQHHTSGASLERPFVNEDGWKLLESDIKAGDLNDTQSFRADGGRYLYQVSPMLMAYGPETVIKCQLVRLPEPFNDPLPAEMFEAFASIVGMEGAYEHIKACENCPEVLLGQWAWTTNGQRLLVSAQADASSTISVLFTKT